MMATQPRSRAPCTCQGAVGPPVPVKRQWDHSGRRPISLDKRYLRSRTPRWHFGPFQATVGPPIWLGSLPQPRKGTMADNLEILNAAVSLLVRAALLAARFSGRVRQCSIKRLAAKDADARTKEILSLKDRVCQLEMQLSILQKHLQRKGQNPRYTNEQDTGGDRLPRLRDHQGQPQLGTHPRCQSTEAAGHLLVSLDRAKHLAAAQASKHSHNPSGHP